jgi:hypothetical protein
LDQTPSLFATQPHNVLLTSLVLTFEGKSEHVIPQIGYSAARLCRVEREIVAQPIVISTEGEQSADVAVIFDLTVPGWLPATTTARHGTAVVSNSYSLFATATYRTQVQAGFLWPRCLPALTRNSKVSAPRVEIEIVRHRVAPPVNTTGVFAAFPSAAFAVTARAGPASPIPNEVVSKMQILVSIPEFISTSDSTIPVSLKTRCTSPGLWASQINVEIDQLETVHRMPDDSYTARFPLPSEQPPQAPLLHQHPMNGLRTSGDQFDDIGPVIMTRSLLDPEVPSRFKLEDGDEGRLYTFTPEWSNVNLNVGIGHADLLPKLDSPFLHIRHTLRVAMHVAYNGGEDIVQFTLPLQFVVLPPGLTLGTRRPSLQYEYRPCTLPAYIQLFHDNGEAKADLSRGVPPAYKDTEEIPERKVDAPEYVPVGTQMLPLVVPDLLS